MSPRFQSIAALVIVALAAAALLRRWIARRRNPGCGGGCGCPASDTRAKLGGKAR
jgi:FeoB-associated Cys-rich membrane protein